MQYSVTRNREQKLIDEEKSSSNKDKNSTNKEKTSIDKEKSSATETKNEPLQVEDEDNSDQKDYFRTFLSIVDNCPCREIKEEHTKSPEQENDRLSTDCTCKYNVNNNDAHIQIPSDNSPFLEICKAQDMERTYHEQTPSAPICRCKGESSKSSTNEEQTTRCPYTRSSFGNMYHYSRSSIIRKVRIIQRIRLKLVWMSETTTFKTVIMTSILVNTITMACEHYEQVSFVRMMQLHSINLVFCL